ncbi:MAG: endonuclease/exonuclease/phosphatase family protein [bacterium]
MPPFTATTFNLRYDRGQDGWFDAAAPRRDRAVTVIHAAAPQVLGVQEALAPQLADLEAALPHHRRVGVGRGDGVAAGEHCALFIDVRRFFLRDFGTFWLSATPGVPGTTWPPARLPRICTWARVHDAAADRPLLVLNAHWDHEAAEARLASAQQLRDFLPPGEPALVMGDFNAGPRSAAVRALAAAGLADAFARHHPRVHPWLTTFHAWTGRRFGPRIDHLLHTPDLRCVAARIDRSRPGGGWPSDHYPLHAALDWA